MSKSGLALSAYEFLTEFKSVLLHQIYELNACNDGVLQDGFNPTFIDDGWVSLKGYAFGYVVHYDDPVRLDMTVGPDWPFVGYRTTFLAQTNGDGSLYWVNAQQEGEIYSGAEQLANYSLRRLASKVGDEAVFDAGIRYQVTIAHDPYYGNNLTAS